MPSEIESPTPPLDRRTRKREARRARLLDLAAELVERDGVAGVTMAALAQAADYAPASLYTYFDSRSVLLAALQRRALDSLREVAVHYRSTWDEVISSSTEPIDATTAALARLWAFSELFLAAPQRHPQEFRLQQQLLVTPGAEDVADAATVVPAAMEVLDVPRELLSAAVDARAVAPGTATIDPLGSPVEPDLQRTFAWIVALNGALMVDSLQTGLRATATMLGRELTASLLLGWGAAPAQLELGRDLAEQLDLRALAAWQRASADPTKEQR